MTEYAAAMAESSKTVDHALRILEALRIGGPGTTAELARRVGISRSAAGRLLASLERHQFARRSGSSFDLGFGLLRFGAALDAGVRRAAAGSLQELAQRFGETAVLAVRDGDDAVAVDQVVPIGHVVSVEYRPGSRHPLTVGAHGLAMLADVHLDLHEVDAALLPRLAEIARVGYAVSHDELEAGITGVAAPILTADRTPIAAIGVIAPTNRFPDLATVAAAVTGAARSIPSAPHSQPAPATAT